VPQPPCNPGTAELDSQFRGRDEHHRAACPGHAVAENPAAGRAPDRAAVSRADHEHITGMIGDAHQDPAGRPSLHLRLYPRLGPRSAPHRRKGRAHPLAGHLAPGLHEPGGWLSPRPVTTGWLPGKDRHQHGAVSESEVFRVSQRCQAARLPGEPLTPATTRVTPGMTTARPAAFATAADPAASLIHARGLLRRLREAARCVS
jgi:hypothetical protein